MKYSDEIRGMGAVTASSFSWYTTRTVPAA